MKRVTILKVDQIKPLDRGGGISTLPLITPQSSDQPVFSTGISTYPKGKGAPMHSPNCPGQRTLLEGTREVENDGGVTQLYKLHDSDILCCVPHACRKPRDAAM